MESALVFVELQLWAVIALLVLFVSGNILCGLYNRKKQGSDPFKPQFKTLWERNELDKLLSVSARYRTKFPNNVDAHYFALKALLAQKRYVEARDLSNHLVSIEPELSTAMQKWFAVTDGVQGS